MIHKDAGKLTAHSPTQQGCCHGGIHAPAHSDHNSPVQCSASISRDSTASHQRFAEKYNLPFILLSDPERQAIEAYGVWQEKKLYGKVSWGIVRTTFIVDEAGMIAAVMPKVKPDTNAEEVLAALNMEK
jgi:peroxiredoxin Q/BCP